jgi:hypothetical protein
MNTERPLENEYAPYYHKYILLVNGCDITTIINNHCKEIINFINSIPEQKGDYAYAVAKWTIKELIQHLIDTERIFIYRALRFSRKDSQALLGFDEDVYVKNANAANRSLQDLIDEFVALRTSSDLFFKSLNNEQLQQFGIANNNKVSVNAIAYITIGHLLHHINIIKERYL